MRHVLSLLLHQTQSLKISFPHGSYGCQGSLSTFAQSRQCNLFYIPLLIMNFRAFFNKLIEDANCSIPFIMYFQKTLAFFNKLFVEKASTKSLQLGKTFKKVRQSDLSHGKSLDTTSQCSYRHSLRILQEQNVGIIPNRHPSPISLHSHEQKTCYCLSLPRLKNSQKNKSPA